MDYIALKWVADNVTSSAYAWAKQGRLKVTTIDGEKSAPEYVVKNLKADLRRTCSLAEAGRLAGIPKGSMRYFIDYLEIVKTEEVAGRERVLRSSIEPAKEYVAGRPERIREANRRAASSPRASLMNLLKGNFRSFLARPFESLQVLMLASEARRITGVSRGVFNRWCEEGKLRKKNLRRHWYVEVASIKSLRRKFIARSRQLKIKI